jgi:hypothetical protein
LDSLPFGPHYALLLGFVLGIFVLIRHLYNGMI